MYQCVKIGLFFALHLKIPQCIVFSCVIVIIFSVIFTDDDMATCCIRSTFCTMTS